MKLELKCEYGKYESGTMKINCQKAGGRCAHVYFKRCKGWWEQTDQAKDCPMRQGGKDDNV